ncbi:hypothetical protein [Archangium lipolyticum]|uniref:hypothetical protein n=1 Tax=Archangium lipolyticum TaxID=2970465 RepID=UPI00214A7FD7|nr:hypothetical protein [Archangium lipolyticum]
MDVFVRCAVLLLLASGTAWAGPRPESRWGLRWNAAPGCIQAAPLARAVEGRLGRTVFGPEPEFLVDGVLERGTPSGWKAKLSLVDASGNVLGSREVSTKEEACTAIEPRLLLVIALMIDPSAAFSSPASPPPPPPPPEPEPEPVTPEPGPREPEAPGAGVREPEPREWRDAPVERRRGPAVSVAVTGVAGLGFGVAPGLASGFWFGAREGTWLLRFAFYPYEPYEKDGGRLSLSSVVAEGGMCPVSVSGEVWSVWGCGTAAFAPVLAYSTGFQQGRGAVLVRGDVGVRARLERRLAGRMSLHASLGAGFGWLRPPVRLLKPDGTAEDVAIGWPVRAEVDVGVTFPGS